MVASPLLLDGRLLAFVSDLEAPGGVLPVVVDLAPSARAPGQPGAR